LEAGWIQKEEANIAAAELDIHTGHCLASLCPENLLDTELEILGLGCLKRDYKKLVNDGGVDSGNGVTEENDKYLLGTHVE